MVKGIHEYNYNWCHSVYLKKYAHGFVVLCFVVVMQSFIINSHEVFIHIYQGCFAGTGAIVRLPQCQWSKPDGYGIISQCITTTKHSKAKAVCIFLGIYCKCDIQALLCPWTNALRQTCCSIRTISNFPVCDLFAFFAFFIWPIVYFGCDVVEICGARSHYS